MSWSLSQQSFGREAGYTLDWSPVNRRATIHRQTTSSPSFSPKILSRTWPTVNLLPIFADCTGDVHSTSHQLYTDLTSHVWTARLCFVFVQGKTRQNENLLNLT